MDGHDVRTRRRARVALCWKLSAIVLAAGALAVSGSIELAAFDLQGHRGARGLFPENSLAAFEAAIDLEVTTLELDVGLTRDGVVVVHHDRRLNPERARGTDGAWIDPAQQPPTIAALDLAALQAYDIGRARPGSKTLARFPDQMAVDGQGIPSLRDVIAAAERRSGSTIRYNIETKISPESPEETAPPETFADALVTLLLDSGVAARTTVQSFDWRTLQRVQETAPEIATSYLTAEREWLDNLARGKPGASLWSAGFDPDEHGGSVPRTILAAGGRVWSPYFRDLGAGDIAAAQQLGLRVLVWTVNDPADMERLIDAGVDGVISDYPNRLRDVLDRKGFRFDPDSRSYYRDPSSQ